MNQPRLTCVVCLHMTRRICVRDVINPRVWQPVKEPDHTRWKLWRDRAAHYNTLSCNTLQRETHIFCMSFHLNITFILISFIEYDIVIYLTIQAVGWVQLIPATSDTHATTTFYRLNWISSGISLESEPAQTFLLSPNFPLTLSLPRSSIWRSPSSLHVQEPLKMSVT